MTLCPPSPPAPGPRRLYPRAAPRARAARGLLEALAAWAEDMDGYYLGKGEEMPQQPTWQTLADMLRAATMYE